MSIFYENILKKISNVYFEEEEITVSSIKMISELKPNEAKLNLTQIPKNVIYQQSSEKPYFLIRLGENVFSFSFMTSSKANISNAQSLTFGIIKKASLSKTIGSFNGVTLMKNHRDSTSAANVSEDNKMLLWSAILASFKHFFKKGENFIYRSTLEAEEFFVLSSLDLEDLLTQNKTVVGKILKKIEDMRVKINKAVKDKEKYIKIVPNEKDETEYYVMDKMSKLNKNVNKRSAIKTIKYLDDLEKNILLGLKQNIKNIFKNKKQTPNEIKKEIDKLEISKKDLSDALNKAELGNFIRTSGYKNVINDILGLKNIINGIDMSSLENINIEDFLNNLEKELKEKSSIIINGKVVDNVIKDEDIKLLKEKVKAILEDNTKDIDTKKKEIKNEIDSLYNAIHKIDYLKNRYVLLDI